ncbi:MAG: TIGR02646 family protein [Verrucomicrobiaceae bacterium]|nr:TIGR02646 family protein [Verrucomicrobiaceae bacterium]
MHPWNRPQEPAELRTQRAALTRAFVKKRRATGKTPRCKWPKVRNATGELMTLQKLLAEHTGRHCNYCDNLMDYTGPKTIDHFLPKSRFPCLVYVWSNLYLCCTYCQRKGTRYNKKALRPDELGYSFSRYFRYHRDGTMSVVANDKTDQERAEITLRLLDLNDDEMVKDRRRAFMQHQVPRRRPLRAGLDSYTASLRDAVQRPSFEDKPFRDFFSQEQES